MRVRLDQSKFDGGERADIEQLRVHLISGAITVRAKQRRCLAAKRYVSLSSSGFQDGKMTRMCIRSSDSAKQPPSMCRLTNYCRPVNSATVPTFWPCVTFKLSCPTSELPRRSLAFPIEVAIALSPRKPAYSCFYDAQ